MLTGVRCFLWRWHPRSRLPMGGDLPCHGGIASPGSSLSFRHRYPPVLGVTTATWHPFQWGCSLCQRLLLLFAIKNSDFMLLLHYEPLPGPPSNLLHTNQCYDLLTNLVSAEQMRSKELLELKVRTEDDHWKYTKISLSRDLRQGSYNPTPKEACLPA